MRTLTKQDQEKIYNLVRTEAENFMKNLGFKMVYKSIEMNDKKRLESVLYQREYPSGQALFGQKNVQVKIVLGIIERSAYGDYAVLVNIETDFNYRRGHNGHSERYIAILGTRYSNVSEVVAFVNEADYMYVRDALNNINKTEDEE